MIRPNLIGIYDKVNNQFLIIDNAIKQLDEAF